MGRGMRYCSRSGGGLIGAGGAAVTVLGVSVARDRLIIPSVAAFSAPVNRPHTIVREYVFMSKLRRHIFVCFMAKSAFLGVFRP